MSNWKTVRLGEICVLNYGKSLTATNRKAGAIPVYSSAGITGWHNEPLINGEGIIIGRKGTVGSVYHSKEPFYCIDTAYYVLPDKAYDFRYLHYRLKSLGLEKLNEDSAVPGLNRETAYSQEFKLPSLEEQGRIAEILGALDDKIECNNRINRNLEEQAAVLFRRWFVDFEFPDENSQPYRTAGGKMIPSSLGDIPKGWQVGRLDGLISIKYGKDHKKLNIGTIPVYDSGGIMRYANASLYAKESVLIPRKGTLNNVFYINTPFWSVDTMFYSEMKIQGIAKFIYFFLKSKDLASMNAGSAVPSMTTEILNQLSLVIPDKSVFLSFDSLISPMFATIQNNNIENQTLATIRDTLFPKLMNNEIKTICQ